MTDEAVFITRLDPDRGLGLRVAVKDCIDVAGTVTTAGCPVIAEAAREASADAACLIGARHAGAHIVGKTNLHELCFGSTGVNPHYGTPRNPLDPARIPGGSSSGSAVAVAAGLADAALGTDTAGSIRNPAACCGVVGLKTTWGRVPVEGTRPLAPSMDTIGPLARDVTGVAATMRLLEPGFTPVHITDERSVRIGRLRLPGVDVRIDAAIDAALTGTGFEVREVKMPGWRQAHHDGRILMYAEALEVNAELVTQHRHRLGADVLARFDQARQITAGELDAVRQRRRIWRAAFADVLEQVGVIALCGYPVFPSWVSDPDPASSIASVAVSFAGFPALCLPVPTLDGPPSIGGTPFPASLQLVGQAGSEELLVGLAELVEERLAT